MLGASRNSLEQARGRLTSLAQSASDAETLSTDLLSVADLLARELPLRRALADPSSPEPAKKALVEGLLRDRISDITLSFLSELVRARWSRPRDLADAVEALGVIAGFLQADADGSLDEVEDELFRFARIALREPALREALNDEALPDDRKRDLLAALLGDKANAVTVRVVTAAAVGAGRRRHLGEGLDNFSRLAADLRERLNARVTVAVELDAAQRERMAEELSRLYGKRIGLRVEVDPSILGGVVIRIGDQVLDGSVARRLDIARRGLTARV